MEEYLRAAEMVDSDHPSIKECVAALTMGVYDKISMSVGLYLFVRDEVRYDPYAHFLKAEHYKASRVLMARRGNCICKAALLCALNRAIGVPARLGFANVKNHLATKQLIKFIGSEIFIFHGYTELFLNKKWVIATPAFNSSLCVLHNVEPLEFDGCSNSVFQSYNSQSEMYMEYVKYHGTFLDVPLDKILLAWKHGYGEKRMLGWAKELEKSNLLTSRDFYKEEIL